MLPYAIPPPMEYLPNYRSLGDWLYGITKEEKNSSLEEVNSKPKDAPKYILATITDPFGDDVLYQFPYEEIRTWDGTYTTQGLQEALNLAVNALPGKPVFTKHNVVIVVNNEQVLPCFWDQLAQPGQEITIKPIKRAIEPPRPFQKPVRSRKKHVLWGL